METLTLHLMNTEFYIAVPSHAGVKWKKPIQQWLQYVATEWSRFKEDNELAKLNALPKGQVLEVSSSLYDCLHQAHSYCQLTEGLFSPYLKNQMERNGYKSSFPFTDSKRSDGKAETLAIHPFVFLDHHQVMRLGSGEVDLGGFAKGYAVEQVARWLQDYGVTEYGLVDGGGDMIMWSNGDKEWTIAIEDPYQKGQDVTFMKLQNGAVATSNRVYRSWLQGNVKKHHLLNGRTGECIVTDIVQATVVTNSLIESEVATKLSFLLPEKELSGWLNDQIGKSARYIVKANGEGSWIRTGGE